MSEHITHVAICQDVRRLCATMGAAQGILPIFNDCWAEHELVSQLGGVTRQADHFSVDVIQHCRQQFDKGEHRDDPRWKQKLAFILGALTHRSIDRHMKPVFVHFKQAIDARIEDGKPVNECTIYCDWLIYNEVYAAGHAQDTFAPGLLDPQQTPATAPVGEMFRHVLRRELIRMHTFKPDVDHASAWLDAFLNGVQDFGIRLHEYERVFTNPDPLKIRRYLSDTNFYDKRAPLVELATRLRQGQAVSAEQVSSAVERTGVGDGRYARAMARSVQYIRAAGQWWNRQIDQDTARKGLDIGVPELDMVYPDPV